MVMLNRLIDVGQRLRLNTLRGVDDKQRAFARGEAAADFIGKVDMARRVHQVQLIGDAVLRGIIQPHRLRLDRDAAFFFNVHIIKDLARHLTRRQAARLLDQPIRKGRLPVINVRDYGKITDKREFGHAAAPSRAAPPHQAWRNACITLCEPG